MKRIKLTSPTHIKMLWKKVLIKYDKIGNQVKGKLLQNQILQMFQKQINQICDDPFNKEDLIIKDTFTTFKMDLFFKIFIYHLIFFLGLGPFTFIILRLFESKQFLINMAFEGKGSHYWIQISQWLSLIIPFYMYIFLNDKGFMSQTIIILTLVQTILRCMIVAVRYATTVASILKYQKEKILNQEEQNTEWIVGWINITPKQLDIEIKNCMIRNEVENVFFRLKFFHKINEDFKNRLLNYNYVNENIYDPAKEKIIIESFQKIYLQQQEQQTLKSSQKLDQQIFKIKADLDIQVSFLETPTKDDLFTYYPGRQVFRELFLICGLFAPSFTLRKYIPVCLIHNLLPLAIEAYHDSQQNRIQEKYSSSVYWVVWI
ncbi:UNKNOWN [Stylonychia lemnae]|uniref:Transmembrane protein n=1 Tax=Stylonychia lemnae TaxID=5949 RepID=A0A078AT58_STYLE|nr:UNKNOWN [Stylonychia lemnae]|eukprot:CDW84058.1 UNKNOWN [Stylonychia lemnae]